MKRIFLLVLLSILVKKSESQVEFCPAGAEWHYSFYQPLSNSHYNAKIKYLKDSLVGTETLRVLSHNVYYKHCNMGPGAITFLKQSGDTVLIKSAATKNTWQILFNYGALAGQSWTTTISSFYNFSVTTTYTITVDSINTVSINNFTLKNLHVKYKNSLNTNVEKTQITERLGCNTYLFNYYNPLPFTDCDWGAELLCYTDDTFGLKQFTNKPCDYQDYVGLMENYRTSNIKIYPNPSKDSFSISAKDELFYGETIVNIQDLYGREIKQVLLNSLNSEDQKIDISDLASGLYVVSMHSKGQEIFTGKLIKYQ